METPKLLSFFQELALKSLKTVVAKAVTGSTTEKATLFIKIDFACKLAIKSSIKPLSSSRYFGMFLQKNLLENLF